MDVLYDACAQCLHVAYVLDAYMHTHTHTGDWEYRREHEIVRDISNATLIRWESGGHYP